MLRAQVTHQSPEPNQSELMLVEGSFTVYDQAAIVSANPCWEQARENSKKKTTPSSFSVCKWLSLKKLNNQSKDQNPL